MSEALIVDLKGDLDWGDFDIPGGSQPVSLAPLRRDEGITAVVRFPAGWHRDEAGAYECGEEFTILGGALHMSGAYYVAPHWIFCPIGYRRVETHVHEDMLCVARFDGPARWREGEGQSDVVLIDAPVRGAARELRPNGTWLRNGITSGPADATVELLSPTTMTWAWIPAGEQMPAMRGPVIERRPR